MKNIKITVPRIDWMIGGSRIGSDYNRYFGSTGTDPLKGFVGQRVFNYTIGIEKVKDCSDSDKEIIKVSFWIGEYNIKNTPEESITSREFDLCEESREKIERWLTENAENALN